MSKHIDLTDIPGLADEAGQDIDEDDIDTPDYGPKPEGEYHCKVDDWNVKPTSAGDGKRLNIEWEILSPSKFEGGKLFNGYNIENPSDEAEEIAMNQLKKLALDGGLNKFPSSFDELIGLEHFIIMRHREYEWEGETRIDEDVKYTKPVDGQPEGAFDEQPDHDTSGSSEDDVEDDIPF